MDVRQGMLGDCYFLAALSSIAEDNLRQTRPQEVQPVLLKQAVFTTAKGQDAGVSICRLCRAGRWQQVPVSHSLPCRSFPPKLSAEMQVPDSRALAFSSSCSGALWVPLLEKAWARINGSFQAAERGDSAEALAALTGAPAKHYRLHPESAGSQWGVSSMLSAYISPGNWASWAGLGISSLFWGRGPEQDTQEQVWSAMETAARRGQPMCASCQGKKKKTLQVQQGEEGGILGSLWNLGGAWKSGSQQVTDNVLNEDSEYEEDQVDEVTGLVGAHCYTVLAAMEVAADKGKSWFRKERWVRLRNPWGSGRWKGPAPKKGNLPFSSAVFDCVGEKVRRGVERSGTQEQQDAPEGPVTETDPGTFWMLLADFMDEFATVCVSEYRPGYISSILPVKPMQTLKGAQTQVSATLRLLASAERTHLGDVKPLHVVISVLQDSDELFTRNKRRKYSSARIEVLEITSPLDSASPTSACPTQGSRHVASSGFGAQREVLLPVELKAGTHYLVIVHWLQASPVSSWNREGTLRVYAPCPARLEHGQGQAVAQREAYEAAAMGPRGACLKEEQGAQLRCWSDRESGTIALCFDASSAPAGLLASLTWKLQNALLQPNFPSCEGSIPVAGEEQHTQLVDLKPGQRQLTVVSWLDPSKSFSANYSWQATADPCSECGAPVGTRVPGRFSGAFRVLSPSDPGGPATLHEECFEKFMMRVAPRCLQCSEAIVRMPGRFAGQFFAYTENQLGNHAAGQVHAECHEEFQKKFAKICLQCGLPVMQLAGQFSGKHFNYKDAHFGKHGNGPVHEECHLAFLQKWAPACSRCKEPLVALPGRFSGIVFKLTGGDGTLQGVVHEECQAAS